jgi:hypothetical protein
VSGAVDGELGEGIFVGWGVGVRVSVGAGGLDAAVLGGLRVFSPGVVGAELREGIVGRLGAGEGVGGLSWAIRVFLHWDRAWSATSMRRTSWLGSSCKSAADS